MTPHNHPDQDTLHRLELLEQFIQNKELLRDTHPLRYLFWESTLQCNLACLHCGSDCYCDNSTAHQELSYEAITSQLDDIANYYDPGSITLAIIGGEPLLRKNDILRVGKHAADSGFHWGIVTNAQLLDLPTITALKQAALQTISISLDGLEKEHDTLRNQSGVFKKTVLAIQNLLADRFYLKFDIICCVSRLNIGILPDFIDFLSLLGVPAVRFTPIFFHGRAGQNQHLALSADDLRQLFSIISHYRETQQNILVSLSEEGYWGPAWEGKLRDELHYCGSGIQIGTILHNGDVIGCPSMSRSFVQGSVLHDSFINIWNNQFQDYRHNKETLFKPQCGTCEHWILCEGGGMHLLQQQHANSGNFCSLKRI